MIYNENGMIITNRKSIVYIGEETIDLSYFYMICESAPYQSEKFRNLMKDIRKDIEECDNDNLINKIDKGMFLSKKIQNMMKKIGMILTIIGTGTLIISIELRSLLFLSISALSIIIGRLLDHIASKPSKEQHLLDIALEAIGYLDKTITNRNLPDEVREKALPLARKLTVKFNKCKEALNGNRWFDQCDWGISSEVLFQKRMVYFNNDITNTEYEKNKEKWDNIVRQMDNAFPKALNDIAGRIKKDYSDNENVSKLSVKDIVNALACYSATMVIKGSIISISALCCEKDAIDSNIKNIPIVLGRVIKIDLEYIDGKITWDYYDTKMRSYE